MFLLLLCLIPLASGHGGMMWPPSWWDGQKVPLEEINTWTGDVPSDPPVRDPASGRLVVNIKSWLTDQVYLEGIGKEEFMTLGNVTNPECLEPYDARCAWRKTSWASPGYAKSLGGGCGIFGGNPDGCDEKDTRPPGSECVPRTVFSGGSDARDLDFPDAATTEMEVGSWQDVAWLSNGAHFGGYTYRLCKLPPGGKKDITEECFAKNVLKFATNYTMMRNTYQPGEWWKVEQKDLTQGTNPPGSAWRHVGQVSGDNWFYLRKDTVIIPEGLPAGDYVMGFRWDTVNPQVWVSCANVRLTPGVH